MLHRTLAAVLAVVVLLAATGARAACSTTGVATGSSVTLPFAASGTLPLVDIYDSVSGLCATFNGDGGLNAHITNSTVAVTGTFYQATQPVSGTFYQATQPVSGTFWQATQPVSGTFWQATQPMSSIAGGIADLYSSSPPTPYSGSGAATNIAELEAVRQNTAAGTVTFGGTWPSGGLAISAESSGLAKIGIVQPDSQAYVSPSTITTTQIVALSSGKSIYISSYAFNVSASATAVAGYYLEYGTGSNCSVGATEITGQETWPIGQGIVRGSGLGVILTVPASNALCIVTSAAQQVNINVSYTQF